MYEYKIDTHGVSFLCPNLFFEVLQLLPISIECVNITLSSVSKTV